MLLNSLPWSSVKAVRFTAMSSSHNEPIYTPELGLDPATDGFRLIKVVKGYRYERITCQLFCSEQDNAPDYQALSYTWGEPDPTHSIDVNGNPFEVRENLFFALLEIRRPEKDITLWVDAICINQANHKERGHQVKQMGSIYETAEEVLVWLGRGDGPNEENIIALMESITWINDRAISAQTTGSKEPWTSLCSRLTKERFGSPVADSYHGQVEALRLIL
jgi:hypothetical protein